MQHRVLTRVDQDILMRTNQVGLDRDRIADKRRREVDNREATQICRGDALRRPPFISIVLTLCGLSILGLNHPIGAQQADDSNLRDHVNRGNQLMSRRQWAAAQAEYEAARKLEPSNQIVKHNLAELFNNWGVSYFRQKSYAEAIAQFQKCLGVMPGHPNAKYNIQLCKRAMQNEGMNPDELPDAASEEKEKSKTEQAKEESKDKKDAAAAAPSGDSMSVSAGSKQIFSTGVPFVSGSSVFPVYSEKSGAAKSTVNVINPAAMKIPGAPTITSTGVAVGSAPAVTETTNPAIGSDSSNSTPAKSPESASGAPASALESASSPAVKPVYRPIAPANSQPAYVPMPATYDSSEAPAYSRGTGDATVTLDEKVAALELKVYGKKHTELPIMRRIDQLETDYIGQIRSGSMNDRVEFLRKSIGQN